MEKVTDMLMNVTNKIQIKSEEIESPSKVLEVKEVLKEQAANMKKQKMQAIR